MSNPILSKSAQYFSIYNVCITKKGGSIMSLVISHSTASHSLS